MTHLRLPFRNFFVHFIFCPIPSAFAPKCATPLFVYWHVNKLFIAHDASSALLEIIFHRRHDHIFWTSSGHPLNCVKMYQKEVWNGSKAVVIAKDILRSILRSISSNILIHFWTHITSHPWPNLSQKMVQNLTWNLPGMDSKWTRNRP